MPEPKLCDAATEAVKAFESIAASAARWGIDRSTFYERFITPGRIRTVKIGRRRLVPVSELERIEAELLAEAG